MDKHHILVTRLPIESVNHLIDLVGDLVDALGSPRYCSFILLDLALNAFLDFLSWKLSKFCLNRV